MPNSNYVRQLILKVRGPGDQAIVDEAALNLGTRAARKGIVVHEIAIDSAQKDERGGITVTEEVAAGLLFVSGAQPSRIYIVAPGNRVPSSTLADMNAAEIVALLAGVGALEVKRITLVPCYGGEDASRGVQECLPQQICYMLSKRGVHCEVAGYINAISVATIEFERMQYEQTKCAGARQPLQLAGRKAFHGEDGGLLWVAQNRPAIKRVYKSDGTEISQSFE